MSPTAPSPTAFARKRDLWWQFTVRTVELRHRGSYLGIVWAVLNPLLLLALYYVIFGALFRAKFGRVPDEGPVDVALAMFLGLILYQLFAETLNVGPSLVVTNPNLVKKVVFPLDILPLAQAGSAWFHLAISLCLLLVGALVFGRGLDAGVLWLPLILAPLVLLTVGLSWLLAALGVFFRDLMHVMPFIAQIILYASAVVYPLQKIHEAPRWHGIALWDFLKWNPMLHIVELARKAVFWGGPDASDLKHYLYALGCGIAVFALGRIVFARLQPAFADVI